MQILNPGPIDGFTASAAGGSFANLDHLVGGSGQDTLNGLARAAHWHINALLDVSTYTSTHTLTFSKIENLVGGLDADIFILAGDITFDGRLDGNGGTDSLNLAAFSTGRNLILSGPGGVGGFEGTEGSISGGFTNLDGLIGSSTEDDVFTGMDADAVWNLAIGGYSAMARFLNYAGFETLIGGSSDDTFLISGTQQVDLNGAAGDDRFVFGLGAILDGFINGGNPSAPLSAGQVGDALDYSAYTMDINVSFIDGTATGTNGISDIECFMGGSGTNTIIGDQWDNVLIGGPSADILIGGLGNDTYIFGDNWGNDIVIELEGEGEDTLDFSMVTGLTGTLPFSFDSSPVDSLVVTSSTGDLVSHSGNNVENFIGGNFGNNFVIQNTASIPSSISGGAGSDRLDLSAAAGGVYAAGIDVVLTAVNTDGYSGTATGLAGTFEKLDAISA